MIVEFQNRRAYMEDTHVVSQIDNKYKLYGVFDGHGGVEIANLCKHNFGAVLKQCITIQPYDIAVSIRQCFDLMDILAKHADKPNTGSTAVISLVTPDRLWFANAGDSMAMVIFMNGAIQMMSYEHKVENEKQRIENLGGLVTYWDGTARINGTLNLSRSIGDHYLKTFVISEPHISSINIKLNPVKYVIMASDGIWDVFEMRELYALFESLYEEAMKQDQKQVALRKALVGVCATAKQKGSGDNITIIYFDMDS